MFKKILLATDGSDFATHAAKTALNLAQELGGSHVTLLHVSSDAPSRSQLMQANLDVKSALKEKAHNAIRATRQLFEETDVPYETEVALGDAADMIVETANRDDIDLIIIGSRGLGAVSSVLLGSVSQRVTRNATCPVMIVK